MLGQNGLAGKRDASATGDAAACSIKGHCYSPKGLQDCEKLEIEVECIQGTASSGSLVKYGEAFPI